MLDYSDNGIDTEPMDPQSLEHAPGMDQDTGSTVFQWEVPGRAASIFVDYDLVDRLGFDIMRGFGAVPRRGAEVGGVLLGTAEVSDRMVVRIEDFVSVPCEHLKGPSFVLSERDLAVFDETLQRWAPAPDKRIYVVGFYRSNTRDALQLAADDLEILNSRFPGPSAVCLLVKPYATRPSEAAFFLRENGQFPTESQPAGFPFRRKEMGGGRPTRRGRGEGDVEPEAESGGSGGDAVAEPLPVVPPPMLPPFSFEDAGSLQEKDEAPLSVAAKARAGWFWIPLSFIFLLLGVVLGFQIALAYRGQQVVAPGSDPYGLELTVVQFGESLHLKWNVDAAPFRNARRGMLHIQDGNNTKEVELKQEDLSRGGVLYPNATGTVKFRLEVFPRERNSVSESIELRLLDSRK